MLLSYLCFAVGIVDSHDEATDDGNLGLLEVGNGSRAFKGKKSSIKLLFRWHFGALFSSIGGHISLGSGKLAFL